MWQSYKIGNNQTKESSSYKRNESKCRGVLFTPSFFLEQIYFIVKNLVCKFASKYFGSS